MQKFKHMGWARPLAAAMTALAIALLVFSFVQTDRLAKANARISASVQKAFYETCELTESMSVNLRKLLVAGDGGQMQQLLSDVSRQAQGASGNLAMLPLGEDSISATLKFINQVGDFAESLSVKLANGGAIDTGDYHSISTLSENAAAFSVGMARLLEKVERGETTLDGSQAAGDESLYPLSNPAAEYPTLLYDGPFSDGILGDEFKALEGQPQVSADEAKQALSAFIGNVTEIMLTGEGSVPVECYEFDLTANGYPLSAGVTKQGGRVLYILSDADVAEGSLSTQQLLDAAETFLVSRGYGDMEMSYYSQYDGILTANYAAVQNGVVLYPDLIKLQLSAKDGAVIGLEAAHYLMNHVERTLELPVITEEEALSHLGAQLEAQGIRLSVIPVNAGEALCYEIRATDGANVYLVYIDALTGAERKLMQVVSDESGSLVM